MLLQNRFCCFLFLWKFHIGVYYVWIIPIHRHPLKFILWSPNHPTWIHDLCCIHMYLLMHAHTPTHTCTHVHVHTYTMFGSCCWDKHQNKRNSGKERVYFRLLFSVHHKTTRTWNRKETWYWRKLFFWLFPDSHSATFLMQLRCTCLGVAPPTVNCTLLYQLRMKKMPYRQDHRLILVQVLSSPCCQIDKQD